MRSKTEKYLGGARPAVQEPRSNKYVRVRVREFDMFSSSSAPRRQTEMSTRVTWIDSESRFPYCQIRKFEAKHSVMQRWM